MKYKYPFFPAFCAINLTLGICSAVGVREARLAVDDARSCRADVAALLESVRGYATASLALPSSDGSASPAPSGVGDAVPAPTRSTAIDDRQPIPEGWRLLSDGRGWALFCDAHPSTWYHVGDLCPFGLIEDIGPHWFFAHGVLYVVSAPSVRGDA